MCWRNISCVYRSTPWCIHINLIKCSVSFKYDSGWFGWELHTARKPLLFPCIQLSVSRFCYNPCCLERNFASFSQFIFQVSSFSTWNFSCCSSHVPQNSQRRQQYTYRCIAWSYYCHTYSQVTALRSAWSEVFGIYWPYDLFLRFQEIFFITELSQLSGEGP